MLTNLGIKSTYEAGDGVGALDAIRAVNPDVMIMDWDMPILDGRGGHAHRARAGCLSQAEPAGHHADRRGIAQSRVTTAMRLGVHEFLVKPISPKTLQQRLLGLILNPRPMVRAGKFYIPMPRRRVDLSELLHAADAAAPREPESVRRRATVGRSPSAPPRSAQERAFRCWRDRRRTRSPGRRSLDCCSGSRSCSGPCRPP